jgi:hypothetical protein
VKLTLHRTGDFMVAPDAEDSTQCGFARGDRQVFFDVSIESDSQYLDGKGFVLDNNAVQHYFSEKYRDVKVFVSCERIACEAIEDLANLMGRDRVFYISCEIKPGTYAGLKAEQRFQCEIDGAAQ